MLKLTKFNDPGHGWLRVPLKIIRKMQANGLVLSGYSYQSKRYAYLEEDCDISPVLERIEHFEIRSVHTNRQSKIRLLEGLT